LTKAWRKLATLAEIASSPLRKNGTCGSQSTSGHLRAGTFCEAVAKAKKSRLPAEKCEVVVLAQEAQDGKK